MKQKLKPAGCSDSSHLVGTTSRKWALHLQFPRSMCVHKMFSSKMLAWQCQGRLRTFHKRYALTRKSSIETYSPVRPRAPPRSKDAGKQEKVTLGWDTPPTITARQDTPYAWLGYTTAKSTCMQR